MTELTLCVVEDCLGLRLELLEPTLFFGLVRHERAQDGKSGGVQFEGWG